MSSSSHSITIGHGKSGAVKLDIARLVVSRMLITAASGGGKSYLLRKVLEGVSKSTQAIVIDTEGEFATLREKRDMVLAGPSGETPADPRSAGLLCRKLMELNLSSVIDISEMARSDKRSFVANFVNTLVDLPRNLWRPCVVCVDETHEFASEGEKSESGHALSLLASKGRKRGYCLLGATQRLQKLDKDVAAEMKNVFIGQMNLDVDLRRAADLLGFGKDRWPEIRDLSSKPGHEGEFFCFGPALNHRGVKRFRGDPVETTHPRAGHGRLASPPAPSEKIKGVLDELKDLPEQAEAEIRDLATAKKTIAELQRELKATHKPADEKSLERHAAASRRPLEQQVTKLRQGLEIAMKVIASIEAKGFDKTTVTAEEIEKALAAAKEQIVKLVQQRLDKNASEFEKFKVEARKALNQLQKLIEADVNVAVSVQHNEPFTVKAPAADRRLPAPRSAIVAADVPADVAEWFRPAHKRLIDSLASLEAFGQATWDRSIVAAMAGVSPKSSSFGNDVSRLSSGGLISYPASGMIQLTDAGRSIANVPDRPASLEDLHAAWRNCPALRPAHIRLLDVLISKHPNDMSREELATSAGVSPASSSFGNDVSRLSSLGLCRYPKPGRIAAGPLLFPESLV